MGFLNRQVWGRTLLVAAALAVGAVCWSGCGDDDGGSNAVSNTAYTLQISINPIGGGTVSRNPDKSAYNAGERVTVRATPASSCYRFVSWSGVSTSANVEIIVTMDANLTLTANFQQLTGAACNSGGGSSETVSLGGLKWMTKNLNVETADSWCYRNSPDSCAKYGRLYTWSAAKAACQSVGMRLPTNAEWGALVTAAGGSSVVGKALKADHGWYNNGNGTDTYGFSALPGGGWYSDGDGFFYYAGNRGIWWTATEVSDDDAYYWVMNYKYDLVDEYYGFKSFGFSARCVQD